MIDVKKIIKKEGILHIFGHEGLVCILMRPHQINETNPNLFHWCGYVVIPVESKVAKWLDEKGQEYLDQRINVHGGITMFQLEDGLLWIGFDCAHAYDICMTNTSLHPPDAVYRDLKYATKEVKSLAEQILKLYAIDHL